MRKAQARACILLALLLAFSGCVFALDPALDISQYAHTSWKIREGFTKGSIFSIAQTPDGYLWLGTEFGLIRFDGVQPIPWQPPNGDQLPDNFVHQLLVSREGTLWIGTEKGLASWKDGQLTQYAEASGHAVRSLAQDAEGTIWFGVSNPGRLCAVRVGKTQCYGEGNFGSSVSALYEDHKGNLWVSAPTGLWRWIPGPRERFILPGEAIHAHALIEDENGVLLMATSKSNPYSVPVNASIEGLKQLVGGKIRSYPFPVIGGHFNPIHMLRSSDGSLWVGTVHGLLHVYQRKIDRFSANDGLSGDIVTCIFEDREGDVWVGTETGLDRFRDFAVPTISVKQGLSNGAVNVVDGTPDGSVWIATADELNRWQNGHMTVYRKRSGSGQNRRSDERDPILNARVTEIVNSGFGRATSLGHDDRGQVWIGSPEGVFYFDRSHFVQVPGLPEGAIFSIAGDGQGKVWISNDEGLFYSKRDGPVQRIPWFRFGHKQAAEALLPDTLQGSIWLGFIDGGISYLRDGQIGASYNVANGLGHGSVSDLQLGSDSALWVATEGGLSRVKNGHVTTLTSGNGLPCDSVQWVIEDDDHSLWLYMPCGLVRIARSELDAWLTDSKRSVQTRVFDSSDGVWNRGRPGQQSRLVTKSPDGKIWFAPPDGVSVLDPHRLVFNKLPPPVHIEKIVADDKTYNVLNGMRLPTLARNLTVDYTALSLVVPEKVHFRYKLEGQDSDWHEVVNVREAHYTNLAPKRYRFVVKACNNSGVWNEEGAALDFVIPAAWYQTNLFFMLCIAAFLASVWGLHQLRLQQLQREEGKLREAIETIPTMAWIAGPDGIVQFVNRRWVEYTGLSQNEAPDALRKAAIHPEDRERIGSGWAASVASSQPFEEELRFRRADGEYRWFLSRAVPLRDKRGKIVKWYGASTDIEDRKQNQELMELHQEEITALNDRLMKAHEEERTRIAGELHDGVLQQLTSLNLAIGSVKRRVQSDTDAKDKLAQLQEKLIRIGVGLRHLSHELHPTILKDRGLPDALCFYCEEFSEARGIPVSCEKEDSIRDLSRGTALALYRIAQEALGNVAKHSRAKQVQVRLAFADGRVRLTVVDDGVGFDTGSSGVKGGLGLINMRERVRQLNGTLEVLSAPGQGTTLTAEVPFRSEQARNTNSQDPI